MFANEDNLVQEVSVVGKEIQHSAEGVFLSFNSLVPQLIQGGHMTEKEFIYQVNVYTDGIALLFKLKE